MLEQTCGAQVSACGGFRKTWAVLENPGTAKETGSPEVFSFGVAHIDVNASQVAYWKLYATDAVDASADFSGIDVVGNENAEDATDDSSDTEDANTSDESDGGNTGNTDNSANDNANASD